LARWLLAGFSGDEADGLEVEKVGVKVVGLIVVVGKGFLSAGPGQEATHCKIQPLLRHVQPPLSQLQTKFKPRSPTKAYP
jgi:hypothetical protein